jgi:hypothetical protein
MTNKIQRHSFTTKNGNFLELFYNPKNNLVVVELISSYECGGNELLRQTIDEAKLLEHCRGKLVET